MEGIISILWARKQNPARLSVPPCSNVWRSWQPAVSGCISDLTTQSVLMGWQYIF